MVSDAAINAILSYDLGKTILSMFFIILIFVMLLSAFESKSKKTKKYREAFSDLYIIGMIRKFAKEDGIDLDKEMIEIRRLEKLEKAGMKSIDQVIETELNEKISAVNQGKIEELKNKKV